MALANTEVSDLFFLKEENEKLQKMIIELREELSQFKPEFLVECDYDNRGIHTQIAQFGYVLHTDMTKEQVDYLDINSKIEMIASEMSSLMRTYIKKQITPLVTRIDSNIAQMRTNKQW
jgi:hypothetical protein